MILKPLLFRQKIVLLAIALVIAVQSVTLVFVLRVIRNDSDESSRRTASLAGAVFDEYIRNRSDQLQTTASVLAADFGFREAVATGDPATITSMLENHSARIDADVGLLIGPDGQVLASTLAAAEDVDRFAHVSDVAAVLSEGTSTIVSISDRAFQIVGVTIRAPLPLAQVFVGFEVDAELAQHLRSITGVDITFAGNSNSRISVFASTLEARQRENLVNTQFPLVLDYDGGVNGLLASDRYLSQVRRFVSGNRAVYAVLQLSLLEAQQSYRDIQWILLAITVASIAAALVGSLFVGRMVTRPVDRLTAAVRRMSEGDYAKRVQESSRDEFGELATGFNSMQTAIADRQAQIVHAANHDSLTGLPNRDCILAMLEDALANGRQVFVARFSVFRLSKLIASFDHQSSDQIIRQIAVVLSADLNKANTLGCLASDEFAVILADTEAADVDRILNALARCLRDDLRVAGTSYSLQCRIGVASSADQSLSASALMHAASIARREAEDRHESIVYYEPGQEARVLRQTRLLGEFVDAVDSDQLEVYLQPKVFCATGQCSGAEALVRWNHPEFGLLTPDEFVETVEKAGSISRLTRWMLRRSIKECRKWLDAGLALSISVNISADDLLDENLPYFLLDQANASNVPPASVTLEVTESGIMNNLSKALSVIQVIHELGFRLSIDDFGTGHSSLAQLRRLPLDELKIDRAFLVDMLRTRDVSIVLATIEMANGLGLDVCAEGIENPGLLSTLNGMGARYGQGYAIARPMPAADFIEWLRAHEQRDDARDGGSDPFADISPENKRISRSTG